MAGLVKAIDKLYTALKGNDENVYSESEKVPVFEHDDIYAVAGISGISFERDNSGRNGTHYSENYSLHIRVLGRPDSPLSALYELTDSLLDRLTSSGFLLNRAEIRPPVQDCGLKRLVLECFAEISGRTEE